jgi:hypothetical protein
MIHLVNSLKYYSYKRKHLVLYYECYLKRMLSSDRLTLKREILGEKSEWSYSYKVNIHLCPPRRNNILIIFFFLYFENVMIFIFYLEISSMF